MAKTDYWATPPWARDQYVLVRSTLDESLRHNHPVRAFDAILRSLDWSDWESEYFGHMGRPPIHPRSLASLLLYGLTRGMRRSRVLEEACGNQLDIMWLMEGQSPDHSTICEFRTRHEKQLKKLFRQVCRLGKEMNLVRLNDVAIDGSTIRANNGRYRSQTREEIEKDLKELEEKFGQMLEDARHGDAVDDQILGNVPNDIPAELQDAKALRQKLQEALQTLNDLDESKKKEGMKTKSRLPETDPDSRILPNKEGGFAPNYTVIATTDGECGFVLDTDVIQGNAEAEHLIPSLERTTETFGEAPKNLLGDGHFAQGHILEALENSETAFYSPLASSEPQAGNPAKRDDLTQPVPECDWDKLPTRGTKKPQLDKAAFVYVPAEDLYYCPQGRRLSFAYLERDNRSGRMVNVRRYESEDCGGCPLRSRCITGKGKVRTIRRDQYSAVRERHAQKMKTPEAQTQYKKRMGIVEKTFGFMKGVLGIRQFLLRGIPKVQTEWRWACLAFNLTKIMNSAATMRAGNTFLQQ